MLYKRNILKEVIQSTNEYPITLLTGARQVGKTTLTNYFVKKLKYNYVSLDKDSILNEAKKDPEAFLNKYKSPLIIDEVQRASFLFQEIVHIVNEVRRNKGSSKANGMFILSGSQKYKLMKHVSESMSGRVGIIEMQPLSVNEINEYEDIPFEVDNERLYEVAEEKKNVDNIYEYIVRGLYPARWEFIDKPIKNFFKNYIETYIERDVSELINVRDKKKFEDFLKILATMTGQELIYDNLAKNLNIDIKTAKAWTDILITGDIVSLLPPYYENSLKKTIVRKHKLYFSDTGLASYLIGISSAKELEMSSFKGPLFETFIYNEIRKTYLNNNIEPQLFYYRDNNQNEIDLIVKNGTNLSLVEIKSGNKYDTNDIKSFKQIDKTQYEIKGKCLLCNNKDAYRIATGIYAYPIKII